MVLRTWLELIFRWTHVVAGVVWIGHLYFFNFVNAQVAKTYDADSKKKVVPELMPRALYWFRWGAAYTWLTGFLLAGLVYYMDRTALVGPGNPPPPLSHGAASGLSFALILFVFFVYDILWKQLATKETVGAVVSYLLVVATLFGLEAVLTPRAVYIHLGMLFGTIMAMNVWMRIWPAQRKIIAAIASGTAPDGALVSMAGLRSKHNTYMSVPLIWAMMAYHWAGSVSGGAALASVVVLVGWGVVKLLYGKAAGPAAKSF